MLIHFQFYCKQLNLFTPVPHLLMDCCEFCLVDIPEKYYKEASWYPHDKDTKGIKYSLEEEVWIDYNNSTK